MLSLALFPDFAECRRWRRVSWGDCRRQSVLSPGCTMRLAATFVFAAWYAHKNYMWTKNYIWCIILGQICNSVILFDAILDFSSVSLLPYHPAFSSVLRRLGNIAKWQCWWNIWSKPLIHDLSWLLSVQTERLSVSVISWAGVLKYWICMSFFVDFHA